MPFPKDIRLKMNIKAREFELAYFVATVKHFSPYVTQTPINKEICTLI